MAYNTYFAGQAVRVGVTFTDSTGAVADPATIYLKYKVPSGTTTQWTYGGAGSILKTSTGVYYGVLDTTGTVGTWVYEWQAPAGTGQALAASQFTVVAAPI